MLDAVQSTIDLSSAIKAWQPDSACLTAGDEAVDRAIRCYAAAGLSDAQIARRVCDQVGVSTVDDTLPRQDEAPWPDEAMIAVARHAAFCGMTEQQIGRLLGRLSIELPDCVQDPEEIAVQVRAACREFAP